MKRRTWHSFRSVPFCSVLFGPLGIWSCILTTNFYNTRQKDYTPTCHSDRLTDQNGFWKCPVPISMPWVSVLGRKGRKGGHEWDGGFLATGSHDLLKCTLAGVVKRQFQIGNGLCSSSPSQLTFWPFNLESKQAVERGRRLS